MVAKRAVCMMLITHSHVCVCVCVPAGDYVDYDIISELRCFSL